MSTPIYFIIGHGSVPYNEPYMSSTTTVPNNVTLYFPTEKSCLLATNTLELQSLEQIFKFSSNFFMKHGISTIWHPCTIDPLIQFYYKILEAKSLSPIHENIRSIKINPMRGGYKFDDIRIFGKGIVHEYEGIFKWNDITKKFDDVSHNFLSINNF